MTANTGLDWVFSEESQSVEYADTPVDRLRENTKRRDYVQPEDWADHHDVVLFFLPFYSRESDPVQLGQKIMQNVGGLPQTQAVFKRGGVGLNDYSDDILTPLLRAHRITINESDCRSTKYWNPAYTHYDHDRHGFQTISDDERRLEFYYDYTEAGTTTQRWLAKHLGMDIDELCEFVAEYTDHTHPVDRMYQTRRRLARTAFTIIQWTDHDISEIATALNYSAPTLAHWINLFAVDTVWKPPERPTPESWFPLNPVR